MVSSKENNLVDNQAQVTNSVSVEDLKRQMALIRQFRAEKALMAGELSILNAKIETEERRMIELFELSGITNFNDGQGVAYVSYRTSIRTPKTPEDVAKLAEIARREGMFDGVFKPNSQALNSFYKSQLEIAKERGDADYSELDFLGVTIEPTLGLRKA
jgi:hypothetical protein